MSVNNNGGTRLPVVAIVGRPNVGKSSLANRILQKREAIVEATPGVTRDRRSWVAEWDGRSFEIVDTGGLEPGVTGLEARARDQAEVAIEAADVIVLVVDALMGPVEDDLLVADALRRSNKPVVVAANKVDDSSAEPGAASFHRLGLGDPVCVSALHGRGSGDLLEALVARLPAYAVEASEPWASIAIVGRPNVGKSSLLNALARENRAIVDPLPGTTRDPVDASILVPSGRRARLIDTAGLRREVQVDDPIEYFSLLRSRRTLQRVDVALLVVDCQEGVTGHEQRIAEEILREGRACVLALNKWDLAPSDEADRTRFEAEVSKRLRFVPWARRITTVAPTRKGVARLTPALEEAIASHRLRLPTAKLNELVHEAQELRPHPRSGGRAIRILYAVQARVSPPTMLLFATGRLTPAYLRYIEHRIRAAEPFTGTPLRVEGRLRRRAQA